MNYRRTESAPRLMNILVLVSLVLVLLPGSAMAQTISQEQGPAVEAAQPGETAAYAQSAVPDSVQGKVACTTAEATLPASAQLVPSVAEDEVAVTFKKDNGGNPLYRWGLNGGDAGVLSSLGSSSDSVYTEWATTVALDFNGDRYDELFTAFKDNGDLLKARSYVGHPPTGSAGVVEWNAGDGGTQDGGEVSYIAVTGGNLLRRADRKEVAVIALRNKDADLDMIALSGTSGGHIYNSNGTKAARYWDANEGRGTVSHVSVDHGDLNGDGWDDEIVTAFRDSDAHLQVLVTRLGADTNGNPNGTWSKVAMLRYTDNNTAHEADRTCDGDGDDSRGPRRGVSVTTGDVNGDGYDEAVVAFVDDANWLQVLALKLSGTTLQELSPSTEDSYFREDTSRDPDYVSVATPDLDGNGQDEIVVAFGKRVDFRPVLSDQGPDSVQLWTLRVVCGPERALAAGRCKLMRDIAGKMTSDGLYPDYYRAPQWVDVQEANLDVKTGEQEVVLAFNGANEGGDNDKIMVESFRQQIETFSGPGIPDPDNPGKWIKELPYLAKKGWGSWTLNDDGLDPSIAVGDFDANSVRLQYTGECWKYGISNVDTVVNVPPMYGGMHTGDVGVALGTTVRGGGAVGETLSGSVGATIEIDGSASVLDIIEVGPVMTTEMEYTHSVTKEQSFEAEATRSLGVAYNPTNTYSDSAFGFVINESTTYQTYKYIDQSGTLGYDVWLRKPVARGKSSDVMEYWNSYNYMAGWTPFGYRNNLALNKTATQSSTYGGASAARAVDGNTDGAFANGSVSHTNSEAGAWWQVDLGSSKSIGSIDIWNRSDGGTTVQNRLSNYVVKVSDTGTDWDNPKWTSDTFTGSAGYPTPVRVSRTGRYVRIELLGTNYLHMAEVQVWGTREVSAFPKAISRTSDSTFTITNQNNTTQTVNGNLKWDWCTGYLDQDPPVDAMTGQAELTVKKGSASEGWNMQTARDSTKTFEDSFSINQSLAFEAKVLGVGGSAGVTWGFEYGASRSLSWGESTYFEGVASDLKDAANADVYPKYLYCPYYYTTTSTTTDGFEQAYMVLDYYVPCIGSTCVASAPAAAAFPDVPRPTGTEAAVKPQTPLIATTTHPDSNAWSADNTATFTWQQPAGDPAELEGYGWFLDRQPDTVLNDRVNGFDQGYTYQNLDDGVWYMHVAARGVDAGRDESVPGEWSETAHRQMRIDRLAPEVTLTTDPAIPNGNEDWYTTPVTVSAAAKDAGSGVAAVEVSTDGLTWQPYTAPLEFTSDTPEMTISVRATDAVGHVSEPVSTTIKVDLTPPDSHVTGTGCIWGVCFAQVVTDAQGNEHLGMAGQIHEAGSGRAGMEIQVNGGNWVGATELGEWNPYPARPDVTVNWVYTGTQEISHGYHTFNGRAVDGAGHVETPYEIARVIWYPLASPDLSQSDISIEPSAAKPGDPVTVTINVRNGGRQEAWVAINATLPPGLVPAPGALIRVDGETEYNPATGVISWPKALLWPGQAHHLQFRAVVAPGMPAGLLTAKLDVHGAWPNTEQLAPAMQQKFKDHEVSATAAAGVMVTPNLPATRDVTAPHVQLFVNGGEVPGSDTASLELHADADVTLMYLREWELNPATGAWTIAASSGWTPYASSVNWALSDAAGVKYIGVWVADGAGNVSRLDEGSLAFTNHLTNDRLLAGERRQYRFTLTAGLAAFNLLAQNGQADLFAWLPASGQYPSYVGVGSPMLKAVGFSVTQPGMHLVEAMAVQNTVYSLLPAYGPAPAAAGGVDSSAALPNRPLAVTTPLTGGAGAAPLLEQSFTYLPLIRR